MQCMKCGRDLPQDQVFCEICQEEMKNYPVKPGTVVLLPHYTRYEPPKRIPKRVITQEEQIRKLKKRCRIIGWIAAVYFLISLGLGWLNWTLYNKYNYKFLPGQNYSAIGSNSETTVPSTGVNNGD